VASFAEKSAEVCWFGITATFSCRICGQESIERFVITHVQINANEVDRKARSYRFFKCQKCGAAVRDDKDISVCFLPGKPAHLKNKGFPVPPNAFVSLPRIEVPALKADSE
jgi:hypothetical protein